MKVKLLTAPEHVAAMLENAHLAGRTCYASATAAEYTEGECVAFLKKLISAGHESVMEHVFFSFFVKDASRALLQELARHRHISLSVQSTRRALKRQIERGFSHLNDRKYDDPAVSAAELARSFVNLPLEAAGVHSLDYDFLRAAGEYLRHVLKRAFQKGETPAIPMDMLKYFLPEFWKTDFVTSLNLRELRHILKLRSRPEALHEFRVFAYMVYGVLPQSVQKLVNDVLFVPRGGFRYETLGE